MKKQKGFVAMHEFLFMATVVTFVVFGIGSCQSDKDGGDELWINESHVTHEPILIMPE